MMRHHTKVVAGVLASTLLLAGCSTTAMEVAGTTASTPATITQEPSATASTVAGVDVDWSALPTTDVTLTDEGLAITAAGTYVLTGSSTGQISVDTDGYVRIILNGVTLEGTVGAAIQIDNAELTLIELAEGTTNTVSDASTRSDEEIDGAIYSSDDLYLSGTGTLQVTANFADGIVGKDDLWILDGSIDVTSVDDGIRGKDSLTISGGMITIDADGDGLKSTNETDLGAGHVMISGGEVTIASGDDAVKAEQQISITGGVIDITRSVEGIEAPVIVIDDGEITLAASDDGINASSSAIITSGLSITFNGGTITIVMGAGDTDAVDTNGDLTVNGGTFDITAQSAFDYDGTGTLNGGTITVNGAAVTTLTGGMGGGGRP